MSRMQGKTSSTQPATPPVYVGIDVSKSHLDVYIHPAGIARAAGDERQIWPESPHGSVAITSAGRLRCGDHGTISPPLP